MLLLLLLYFVFSTRFQQFTNLNSSSYRVVTGSEIETRAHNFFIILLFLKKSNR